MRPARCVTFPAETSSGESRPRVDHRRGSRLAAGIVALVALFAVVPTAPAYAGTAVTVVTHPTLRQGSVGPAVVRLQRLLGVPADGVFGPVTRGAVRAFQRRGRLPVTGVVNAATWNALIAAARSSRDGGRAGSLFACPVDGPVHFMDGVAGSVGSRTPLGTDMMAARGTPIAAVADGVIVRAFTDPLGSLTVILRSSNGDEWVYSHNDRNLVSTGARVSKGQHLALVGSSGTAGTTTHLLFQWWPGGGAARNPYPIVKAACG